MKQHPECIVGTYYNYYTKGAVSFIQLRSDSTYIHVCKYRKTNYVDSGRWGYQYDEGQNNIILGVNPYSQTTFIRQKEEGADSDTMIWCGFYLRNCVALCITEESEKQKLNFYKGDKKPSWLK
ncbi:MAG TPA: hypothetical protein VK806_07080 [Bacteroidia bacterium]|nr:hypothetical protein [Bacteroidia bacterium]